MSTAKGNSPVNAPDHAGSMLASVLAVLDRHAIPYCVPHGYETYPEKVSSDVDLIVDPHVSARDLQKLFSDQAPSFGARLVRSRGRHLMLSRRDGERSHTFLTLDFDPSSQFDGVTFFTAKEMLRGRRRQGDIWIPAVELAFGHYLARTLARGLLDRTRTRRLEPLFHAAPERCAQVATRLLVDSDAAAIRLALESGDWGAVTKDKVGIRDRLLRRNALRHPLDFAMAGAKWAGSRVGRLLRPDGMTVVALGPDGAGKSSTTDALAGPALVPVFDRSVCQGFVPPLHRLLGRNHGPSSEPHALPPRPLAHSLLRCGYWLAYSILDQVRVHLTMARGGLVLYDRHVVDVLVDQKRYRYNGPGWPIRLIWALVPKPDLLVVLTAPAATIQARKQEVPFEVTERQLEAYTALAASLPYGRAVDASRPFNRVVDDINEVILSQLEARIRRRLWPYGRRPVQPQARGAEGVISTR